LYQAPDGYIVVLWLRTFLLSYASFCLLLFFAVPVGNTSLTVSERASESKRSSSVIESGDLAVKTTHNKENNSANNPTAISEVISGNSPLSRSPQKSHSDNSEDINNKHQSQEESPHEKSESSEENKNKQENSSSNEE
jgi:hypothetical protein